MASFLVFKKFTKTEAKILIEELEQWFKDHPKRKVCNTDLFKVKRNKIKETVYKHTK